MGYLDGFGVIVKKWVGVNTPSGARVTVEYPEEVRPKPERFHGRHVLNRYEDGMEKCIGCELCAGVCPAKCIYVRGADNDPDNPTSPGERFGYVYEINYLRCIHCDLCVEACPTEAITESKLFEFSFTNRSDAIYTKAELVVGDDGHPQQLPWENWDGGFDPAEDISGWMRATSPGGDADFKGIIAWAGELGYGVRPPERATVLEEVGAVPAGSPIHEHPLDHVDPAEQVAVNSSGTFDAGSAIYDPTEYTGITAPEPEEVIELVETTTTGTEFEDQAATTSRQRGAGEFDAPAGMVPVEQENDPFASGLLGSDDPETPAEADLADEPLEAERPAYESDPNKTGYFEIPDGVDPKEWLAALAELHREEEARRLESERQAAEPTPEEVEPEQDNVEGTSADDETPPEQRMGYFDAPEEESTGEDKKKRRFFR